MLRIHNLLGICISVAVTRGRDKDKSTANLKKSSDKCRSKDATTNKTAGGQTASLQPGPDNSSVSWSLFGLPNQVCMHNGGTETNENGRLSSTFYVSTIYY